MKVVKNTQPQRKAFLVVTGLLSALIFVVISLSGCVGPEKKQIPSGEESAGLPEIDRRNYPPKPAETTRQLLRVDINPDENKFIGRLLVGIGQPSETSLHVYVDTETLSRMTAKDQHFLLWCLDGARNQVRQTIADSPQ